MGDVVSDGSRPSYFTDGQPKVPVTQAMFWCFVACLPFWVTVIYLVRAWVS